MTLAQILAQLCGGNPVRLVAFLEAFPTQATFDAVYAAFGSAAVLQGFLATRYQGDFKRLRADYDKLGAATLTAMVAGTAKARVSVGAAVDEARRRLDAQLPPVAAAEPQALGDARAARARIDALWNALAPYPIERDLRAVVEAIKTADGLVEKALKVTPFPTVDPAVQKDWDERRAAVRDRVLKCREALVALRRRALAGTDFSLVTGLVRKLANDLSELDSGGVDEGWMAQVKVDVATLEEEVERLIAAVDRAIREARVEALLQGPFDTLGAGLPAAYEADLQQLEADPLAMSEARLAEIEKALPKIADAYAQTRGMEEGFRARVEALYGESRHKEVEGVFDQIVADARLKDWPNILQRYRALAKTLTKVEQKAIERDSKKQAAFEAAAQAMAAREAQDAAALSWGQTAFKDNAILSRVWQATYINRLKCQENARISGNDHSWEDVTAAIALWVSKKGGSGVVTNLHVPGGEPEAKWEKDPARKVAQANFICTWLGERVDIHVTLGTRSFLKNGTWNPDKLPKELEKFKP